MVQRRRKVVPSGEMCGGRGSAPERGGTLPENSERPGWAMES